jgi:hypothetical protein
MPVNSDPTTERNNRADGTYSIITYLDFESFSAVPKSRATGAAIAEYDAEGNMVSESVGIIAPPSA